MAGNVKIYIFDLRHVRLYLACPCAKKRHKVHGSRFNFHHKRKNSKMVMYMVYRLVGPLMRTI